MQNLWTKTRLRVRVGTQRRRVLLRRVLQSKIRRTNVKMRDFTDKMRKSVESVLSEDFSPQNAFAAPVAKRITEHEYLLDKAKELSTEPINDLKAHYQINEIEPTMQDALNIPLNDVVALDMYYRYANNSDSSINLRGEMGSGKSNGLLHFGLLWSKITSVPYRMSNITWDLPSYNLLLKGLKVREVEGKNEITLEEFDVERGSSLSLDEAGDSLIAGNLSMTIAIQTADMEARYRAKQVMRIAAGVKEILHISYFSVFMIKRNTKEKICTGIVYAKRPDHPTKPLFLGYVNIPYVKQEIYDAYNTPKMKSIDAYGRGATSNRVASIFEFFRKELWEHPEFQALPIKPPSMRLNWLKRNPRYSIFPTEKYFVELYRMSVNQEFFNKQKRLDVFPTAGVHSDLDSARQEIANEWSKMKADRNYRPVLKPKFFARDLRASGEEGASDDGARDEGDGETRG